jgi:SET domain-containing protein
MNDTVTVWTEVRDSQIHGGGLFATKAIPAGTRIIEYLGEKITKAQALVECGAGNHFVFTLDDEFDLNGNFEWNTARFINHSCAPNCEAELDEDRVWILALRDIAAGEELTYNYGYDLEEYREHPCRCGSKDCLGFIVAEEFFPMLRSRAVNTS